MLGMSFIGARTFKGISGQSEWIGRKVTNYRDFGAATLKRLCDVSQYSKDGHILSKTDPSSPRPLKINRKFIRNRKQNKKLKTLSDTKDDVTKTSQKIGNKNENGHQFVFLHRPALFSFSYETNTNILIG